MHLNMFKRFLIDKCIYGKCFVSRQFLLSAKFDLIVDNYYFSPFHVVNPLKMTLFCELEII